VSCARLYLKLAFLCAWPEIDTLIIDPALTESQREVLDQTGVRVVLAGRPEEFAT